jgi:hypothetical protein
MTASGALARSVNQYSVHVARSDDPRVQGSRLN